MKQHGEKKYHYAINLQRHIPLLQVIPLNLVKDHEKKLKPQDIVKNREN